MELMQALRSRRSVRVFDGTPVDRAVLEEIIAVAALAPSRMNRQPWFFHVATGDARRRVAEVMAMTTSYLDEYMDVLGPEGVERAARFYAELGHAPVVIGVATPKTEDRFETRDFAISVGASVENLLLAAADHGLGTCVLSVPHWVADQLTNVFEIDPEWEIVSLVVLGYADETPRPQEREAEVAVFLE
jgi:nitroreductase